MHLMPDLKARGVQDSVINGVEVVDYKGFVELTVSTRLCNPGYS